MLVITRKSRESLFIGRDIEVTVLKVRGNRVQLGIRAPADVPICREELRGTVVYCPTDSGNKQARPIHSLDPRAAADHELEGRVKNFLERLDPSALHQLQVEVRNGAAVVSGCVHTFYQKQLATSCCQRVAGVLNVLNEVRVVDSAGTCENGLDAVVASTSVTPQH